MDPIDKKLEQFNKEHGYYGISAIHETGKWYGEYYREIRLLYVHTGDSYTTTLIYDTKKRKFFRMSIGHYLETNNIGFH